MFELPPRSRVLVAMSGGVDSSVAAALLKQAGHDVVGVFMRLGTVGESLDTPVADACDASPLRIAHKGCCSVSDAADARLVAAQLDIPLYVCNFKRDFNRVIDYFVDEYAAGRTPNPCVRCNDWLKFGKLHDYARSLGCDFVASGHYAQRSTETPPRLLRALDPAKDQSYVLFGIPRDQLARTLFPVGHLDKPAVRDLARRFHLPVFDKPDSQEICFVPDDDYARLVEQRRPDAARPGRFLDDQGRDLGLHAGQHRFTVGQRRGLSLSLGHPVYVLRRDPHANTVTVGDKPALLASGCLALEANWLIDPPSHDAWLPALAKYRYNTPPAPARFRLLPDRDAPTPSGRTGAFEVRFDTPQLAIAPGQAIVLYDDDHAVLGGGWIEHALPATPHLASEHAE